MSPDEFIKLVSEKQSELKNLVNRILPIKGGAIAVDHFKDNFRKGGFVNGGLKKWKESKRINESGKSAASKYKTLLSSRNRLYNSITNQPRLGESYIYTDVEYASIHNEGGFINRPARSQVLHFNRKGRFSKNNSRAKYAQKVNIGPTRINMPKRQFIGQSKELDTKIENLINNEIKTILK